MRTCDKCGKTVSDNETLMDLTIAETGATGHLCMACFSEIAGGNAEAASQGVSPSDDAEPEVEAASPGDLASSDVGAGVMAMVKQIVVEKLERKPDEVTAEARFIEDLGADSLDLTELLMALEEEYKIDIDDEATELQTVGDAVKYIESKLQAA